MDEENSESAEDDVRGESQQERLGWGWKTERRSWFKRQKWSISKWM